MEHRKVVKNKKYSKRSLIVLTMLVAGVLAGCGNEENPVSIPTAVPMQTEIPVATVAPTIIPDVTATPEVTAAPEATATPTPEPSAVPEPTATPQPYDPVAEGYPELKADGRSWGLSYRESGLQPWGNETPKSLAAYNAYYVGDAGENTIYLTFDCGYENGNTDAILKALENHGVKGTFFVTGAFLEDHADLVNRMIDEGHAVGNHSYNHPNITTLDEATFREELDSVKKKFQEVTNGAEFSMYFRPPEGRCYSQTLKWSKDMGYATVLWSLAHVDWYTDNQPDPQEAIEKLTARIHPGAIVLLHNTSQTNGEIIDELITKWEEMGYTIKPLSNLTGQ